MKTVGDLFASGEMQLPFVLQSAETMKAAVAHLEPHMEKADQGGKGTVVLATVKGDVHDIGKNLVDIILTNNGYEVVNLGIKVGVAEMIAAVEEHRADALGHERAAGQVHPHHAREPRGAERAAAWPTCPVLLGGAALTRTYVERDLRQVYEGRLFYGRDAFEGLRTMDRLVELKRGAPDDPEFGREISERRVPKRSRLDPDDAPGRGPARPRPRGGGRQPALRRRPSRHPGGQGHPPRRHRRVPEPDRALPQPVGLPPRGRARTTRPSRTGSAPSCATQLATAKEEDLLVPQVAWGHFAANAEGNDLVVYKDETRSAEWMRFTFPRQRKEPWLCIADFFRPADSGEGDFASFMLVTMGARVSEETARLFAENEYRTYLFLHGLGRRDGRGPGRVLAPPHPRGAGLRRRGRPDPDRPVPPAVPRRPLLLGLPGLSRPRGQRQGGRAARRPTASAWTVSEGFQLHPEQTTDAIICHHPQAKYFVA